MSRIIPPRVSATATQPGRSGKRSALPNARIMIHQPGGGVEGQASDIEIHATEILKLMKDLNRILAKLTGQSIKRVEKDTDRNKFMSVEDSKTYGLIDNILDKRS